MKTDIMVTVMVTFYNQKKYIFDSLNAIFHQKTDFKYEVICGDDGSSDGTYEELLRWQEKYPEICTVLQMPREQDRKYEPIIRVSNNRHHMLKHARGKYVTFLDGDDYYTDTYKLQKQVDLLEKHTDCMACGHPVTMLWEEDPHKKQVLCYITDHAVRIKNRTYWTYWWLHAETFLFRNVYQGKEDLINKDFFDDNLITCYFIKHGDVIYIPDNMVVYRQISGSSWNMRTDLQKAIVNMKVYSESKKIIPEMKIQCFMRCQSAWKRFYENRKTNINLGYGEELVNREKFVKDTLQYQKSGILFKIWYEVKYSIPTRIGRLFTNFKRLQKILCRIKYLKQ